ncbi:MAG: hypothetical protein JOZ30_09505, partial [Hyphomicrobiales bacterium]|nr:hypothetical protein [Hyphomicrobiales bacterium]
MLSARKDHHAEKWWRFAPVVLHAACCPREHRPRRGRSFGPSLIPGRNSVGLGTARVFDVGNDEVRRAELEGVVSALVAGGGSVIDTSSDYGTAEGV